MKSTRTSKSSNPQTVKSLEKIAAVVNPFQLRVKCEVPGNGDFLENLLRQHPIPVIKHKDNPQKVRDKLAFILGLFVRKCQGDDFFSSGQIHDRTFRLCAQYLHLIVRDYRIYIKYLIDHDVIDLIDPGTVREKCGTYRFKSGYIGMKTTKHIILDPVFASSIYHHLRSEAVDRHPILFEWICKLSVDWEHALYIRDKLISEGENPNWERSQEILWEIHDSRMARFKLARTNRLITSVSGLQSEYRAALRIDGKPLAGLDIKNSIPFLSMGLFDLAVLIDQGLFDEIIKYNPRLRDRGTKRIKHTSMTTAGEAVEREVNVPSLMLTEIASEIDKYPDVKVYIEKVETGKLYDELADDCEGLSDGQWSSEKAKKNEKKDRKHGKTIDPRSEAKKGLMKSINGQEFADPFELQMFRSKYPTVEAAFREIQEGFQKTRNGSGNSKWQYGDQVSTYAYVTQRFEARILLDNICGRISRERPEVPLVTIHDSIYTLPEYVGYVYDVMVSEIQKIIGHSPLIDQSDYAREMEEFNAYRVNQNQPNSTLRISTGDQGHESEKAA